MGPTQANAYSRIYDVNVGDFKFMQRKALFFILLPLVVFILLSWWTEWLRFDSPRLNYLVFGSALALGYVIPKNPLSKPTLLISVPVSILKFAVLPILSVGWLFLILAWLPAVLIEDIDYSFEKKQLIKVDNENYQVYRTNGGGTTKFGIIVRKEVPLFGGLNYVQRVFSAYPASEVVSHKLVNGEMIFETN
ncbi:MAG: hypothetical protein AXW14_01150 [Alteromonas sp. Nap_26]|nr:MAG: hypothetical protein AXW14_01150 [Alteromonas sp. Nap_26]